jgi:hypothetical protein
VTRQAVHLTLALEADTLSLLGEGD